MIWQKKYNASTATRMLKATRDTGAVLPTYAWTMPTPSYVTSSLAKNCPPANAISGALLQRNKALIFLYSPCDVGLIHQVKWKIINLSKAKHYRPPRYLLK